MPDLAPTLDLQRPGHRLRAASAPHAHRRGVHRAADVVANRRRALIGSDAVTTAVAPDPRPRPAGDDLVEAMAAALVRAARFDALDLDDAHAVEVGLIELGFAPLDAGRADVVRPATARARARLGAAARRDALTGRAADAAALGTLALACTAASFLACAPARAAGSGTTAALLTDERLFSFFTFAPFAIAGLLMLAFCWRERGTARVVGDEPGGPDLADIEVRARAADRG